MSGIQGLGNLPSEILLHVLTLLETRDLLPLTIVSHRFHSLIIRILHARLLLAAPPAGLELILDCYRPAAKYSEPAFNCVYLGTDGLEEIVAAGSQEAGSPGDRLKKLNSLYSRFRPHRRPEPKPRRHPAGDIPGSRTYSRSARVTQQAQPEAQSYQAETYPRPFAPDRDAGQNGNPIHGTNEQNDAAGTGPGPSSSADGQSSDERGVGAATSTSTPTPPVPTSSSSAAAAAEAAAESTAEAAAEEPLPTVKIPVHLDGSELFTQLCTNAMLVIPGPKSGLFRSSVPVHDCIIRVWRHWLASEAAASLLDDEDDDECERTLLDDPKTAIRPSDKGKATATPTPPLSSTLANERGIIWSNKSKEVCIRFRVRERTWRRSANDNNNNNSALDAALRYHQWYSSDELPVTYELEFLEILVRTSHLLFKMEEARSQLHDSSGKAMVFGQFS